MERLLSPDRASFWDESCSMKVPPRQISAVAPLLLILTMASGYSHFGHFPENVRLEKYQPGYGYLIRNMEPEGNSEEMILILSFSGGGMTYASSYVYPSDLSLSERSEVTSSVLRSSFKARSSTRSTRTSFKMVHGLNFPMTAANLE